ncbi:polysaccharide deacetylase family protein [Odoribacter laneus]|uniref:polysaccharide deacetylase family protein n=1 Tax=Odoribacter laneus TaxID=626933 RepID=UPI00033921E5|nr:polysaccharide deacetylase family protein [Odoribacter laneus]CCZ81907.1 polysaccharide deacetylase [Odoribacter laneus CAG:561]
MRKAIAFVLYWLYFLRIKREVKRTDSVLTIYGHDISREAFEGLVKWLLKRDYHFITQDELFDYLDGKERNVEKLVWLSFDDGWKSNYDNVFPILKKYNIPATIFVATKGIEDGFFWFNKAFENREVPYYQKIQELWEMPNKKRVTIVSKLHKETGPRLTMIPEELKEMTMSKLISWGNHTDDHVMSDNCSLNELREEIFLCQKKMKKWTGIDCNSIYSYPNGNIDAKSERLIKEMGFRMAVTTEMKRTFHSTSCFNIPRTEFKEASTKENVLQIYGIWTLFFDKIKKLLRVVDQK